MAVLAPVFAGGELGGFSASMAHKSDIGGPAPGSCSGQALETFNEGVHFPPVLYERAGRRVGELDRILAANSRTPEVVVGDLHGQVGACRLGERRVRRAIPKDGSPAARTPFWPPLDQT